MTTQFEDVLQRFEGVQRRGDSQAMARCPAHQDRKASLSVGAGDKGVVLHCQAGCDTGEILRCVGLQQKDLFYDSAEKVEKPAHARPSIVATYDYPNGAQKIRRSDKSFTWRHRDESGAWVYNRQGVKRSLYIAGELDGLIYVAEGEKDADSLHRLGCSAVSGEDGAGPGKWRDEYNAQLRGHSVAILPDNDAVGRAYARETAAALYEVCERVWLLDLSEIWPEIPEHGDISDLIDHFGDERACEMLAELGRSTAPWEPGKADPDDALADPFLSCFKPLDDFNEEEARWLVPGWLPSGQITLMAADGGVGKTTLWCHIIAALSAGRQCVLDPPDMVRKPLKILFMTTEDSVRKKLRKKLRLAGANMANILTPDFVGDRTGLLHELKFGTARMEQVLRHFRPALVVYDPVQGFLPPKVNMGSRNEMRDCLAPLLSIGEEINCTALIVCHTNKRKGASGRDRIADSADLWDIARSVLMLGFTEDRGVRYLSNEKNNYSQLEETVLFSIDGEGQVVREGTSWKRDREYVVEQDISRSAPKREDCKNFIIQALQEAGGVMPASELDKKAEAAGHSFTAVKRAKGDLKKDGMLRYSQTGSTRSGGNQWNIMLSEASQTVQGRFDLLIDEATPFEETN